MVERSSLSIGNNGKDWIVADLPVVTPGLFRITLDSTRVGGEKNALRIFEAQRWMHTADLFGKNPLEDCPSVIAKGLSLYKHLFPDPNEREHEMLILERLGNRSKRRGRAGCFDVIVGRDKCGRVISWHQFSTIPLNKNEAIIFMQYTGNSDARFMEREYGEAIDYHRHGIYTYNIALMQQIADVHTKKTLGMNGQARGYILESEFNGQARAADEILLTQRRLHIHGKTGAKAIILRTKDGRLISPHCQPKLSKKSQAIKLLLLYRRNNYDPKFLDEDEPLSLSDAFELLMGFVRNFDHEGFDPEEVEKARNHIKECFDEAESAILMPPSNVPSFFKMCCDDPWLQNHKG